MAGLLLDTCAVIWLGQGQKIKDAALAAISEHIALDQIHVSPFTAWELALLSSRGRLTLSREIAAWFDDFVSQEGVVLGDMPVAVMVAAHQLPGSPPNDPVDRILIATARHFGQALVTRDRLVLDYGKAGFVQTIAC